jgi:hypothetical protein
MTSRITRAIRRAGRASSGRITIPSNVSRHSSESVTISVLTNEITIDNLCLPVHVPLEGIRHTQTLGTELERLQPIQDDRLGHKTYLVI